MKKHFTFLLVVSWTCLVLAAPSATMAGPPSIIGGAPMSSGTAHHVGTGWPSLKYDWWHSGKPDWAIGGELVYGDWSASHSDIEIGGAFNATFRWRLRQGRKVSTGFLLAPGLLLAGSGGNNDRFVLGVRAELGVPVSINVHPRVNIVTGGTIPLSMIYVQDADPFVVIPLLVRLGVEVKATHKIVPWFIFEPGIGMAFGDFGSDVDFAFRVWAGCSFH